MFPSQKEDIPAFRTGYARSAEFCEIFQKEMKPLYLLAFLLTANHTHAEQCFNATLEDALGQPAVFKEWAFSWVKRSMIKNAIRIMSPTLPHIGEKQDLWGADERSANPEIDAVATLPLLERFVYVMSILEGYSRHDCSLLLGCSIKKIGRAGLRAVGRLASPDLSSPGTQSHIMTALQATA
jgi:hypothetical protein